MEITVNRETPKTYRMTNWYVKFVTKSIQLAFQWHIQKAHKPWSYLQKTLSICRRTEYCCLYLLKHVCTSKGKWKSMPFYQTKYIFMAENLESIQNFPLKFTHHEVIHCYILNLTSVFTLLSICVLLEWVRRQSLFAVWATNY